MPEINIKVRDKCAEGEGVVICNNSDYTVVWDLDSEWEPYSTRTMRVNLADGTYQDVVFTGDNAALPVQTASGWVSVGLYAGDLHTSRAARLLALSSVLTPSGSPAAPAEDVYAQIMAKLNELSTVSPEDIAKAVEDYLAEHPIEETDPTVPEWAKADITGATVGQIAKIYAVDDNGKPTAWETIDGYTGQVTVDNLTNPDHPTDLVQYAAFQAAVPLVQQMGIFGATVGQIIKVKAVNSNGCPTAWEPVDMPSGGGAPFSFDLIVDHTVTAEDLSVIRLTWTNETIQDLGKYNLFYAVIESDTEFGVTKWVKFYINNLPVSQFSGSSSPKCKRIPATCNRFFGKWIGTSVYNSVNSVPFPVLVGPCENVYQLPDALKSAEDAMSIAIGSYAADYGLAEGMSIKVYAMI